jgi:glycosyltransferase involved in cell wall biosynthesis
MGSLKARGFDIKYGSTQQYFSIIEASLAYHVIMNGKVDIIHLHWQHPFLLGGSKWKSLVKSLTFIIQILFVRMIGIKLIWTVHNVKNHENRHRDLELFFTGKIARLANKIIVHCNESKKEIVRLFDLPEKKVAVIPHGNFIGTFLNDLPREKARADRHLSATDFVFLFFGLIRPYKGVLELVNSFKKLDPRFVKLIVAGKVADMELEKGIKEQAEGVSNIHLALQFIKENDVQRYMNAADVVVLPYKEVLNSGGIFTAISFGKPVIAPRTGCIPEVLNDSGSFLYDPAQEDALFNAMTQAIASKNKLQEMGRYNFQLAKKFDWSEIAALTSQVYERC